jgi:hypothetical protein
MVTKQALVLICDKGTPKAMIASLPFPGKNFTFSIMEGAASHEAMRFS